jgi:hypothetical protein
VNNLKEPPAIVIGDSGAAPTLISEEFLNALQLLKPRSHKGCKLKLLQLTGQAACECYVQLNLYFPSQLGVVCLKGVEAYVVKDMKVQMLIGEDTQSKWNLHTVRRDGKQYWLVGESPHRIAAVEGNVP